MSKTRWPSAVMLALLVLLLGAGRYGPLHAYVESAKSASGKATYAETGFLGGKDRPAAEEQTYGEEPLRAWLKKEAQKRTVPAKDAVVDRVWKAIPGYNGRAVDLEATYAKAKAAGWTAESAADAADKVPWVYKEIEPKVSLRDLPPSPVYRGNPAKPAVGLMINVAWGNEYLASILKTLDDEHVKATFFLDGSWLSKNKEAAEEIIRRGHEVSNHAYTHKNMSTITDAKQLEEIAKTQSLLKKSLNVNNRLFAPPSGDFDARTVRIAAGLGLTTVLWTLDTVDWKRPPAAGVIAKIGAGVGPGMLILMHPTSTTEQALKGIIRQTRSKGLVPGTVSEVLSERRLDASALGN
ncbi:polysaccharide deacetylase family protein [Cohnella sp. GCM10020058]|uniref:polysaccharide deacetylase family protein n=1 Tax=Cohnella sp. GCM10020058 TaxID=3317330 RepID=UPI003636E844